MQGTKPTRKLARRQHIVSSWYLDNFCDSGGRLYVYERGKDIRGSVPRNECVERDFYELDLAGRKTSNDYEDWLSRIEGEAKAIFPSIVGNQRINPNEAAVWSYFVASIFYRTRKVRSQISSLMVSKLRAEMTPGNGAVTFSKATSSARRWTLACDSAMAAFIAATAVFA